MRKLSDLEKRTLRRAAMVLAACIALFGSMKFRTVVEARRLELAQVSDELLDVKIRVLERSREAKRYRDLRDRYRPATVSIDEPNLVTDVRVALEKAAQEAGVTLGPTRETHRTGAIRALLQFQASGEVSKLLDFMHRVRTSGYPLVIDRFGFSRAAEDGHGTLDLALAVRQSGRSGS